MPTTYVPRAHRAVTAVQLKADLLVEKGHWITIDEDDEVNQLSPEEFQSIYGAPALKAVPKAVPKAETNADYIRRVAATNVRSPTAKPSRPHAKGASARGRTIESALTSQPGRIFFYLRSLGRASLTSDIYPLVTNELDQNKSTISAALCVLRDLGLVSADREDGSNRNFWNPTSLGIDSFDEFGLECFLKYALPIPPLHTFPGVKWKRPDVPVMTLRETMSNGARARMD